MAIKSIQPHQAGLTWVMDDGMRRASHALGRGAVGVHPVLRLTPPRVLVGIDPGMLLVGHGAPVETDAAASLRTALARSRSDIPRLLLSIPGVLRGG
jgi:hypothetical protein